jgi:hypothetical protein
VLPRPPFVPAWIPDWLLIANTLAVEVAVALAVYIIIVRRAERKRRALAVFAVAVLLLGALEVLAFLELALEPRFCSAVFVHDRFPDVAQHPEKFVRFYFSWQETRVLHRASQRNLVIDEHPTLDTLWWDMYRGDGFEIRFLGGRVYDGKLPEELWALHDGPQGEKPPHGHGESRVLSDDWAPHDSPEDKETARALWEALARSPLVDQVEELPGFVGKPPRR